MRCKGRHVPHQEDKDMTRRFESVPTPSTRGVLFVHSAPAALCPHIEWGIAAVLDAQNHVDWTQQPAQPGTMRMELSFVGEAGVGARLASKLAGMQRLRFEVTEEPTTATEGQRYAYTPALGLFTSTVGLHGDIMISEERLRHAIAADALGELGIHEQLANLLGTAWDDELEIFRHASEFAPVRWLHQVG